MSLVFFNDPKVGPRWHGYSKFLQEVPEDRRIQMIDRLCAAYPTWFLEWLTELEPGTNTQLEEYQILWMLDESRFKAMVKGRQAGASTALSGLKLWKGMVTPGYRVDIVSVTRAEAQDKIRTAKNLYMTLPQRWRLPLNKDNTDEISFRAGPDESRIRSVGASSGVRGSAKDITFDEAAFSLTDELYKAAQPAISRSTEKRPLGIEVISTPNGHQGKFFEIVTNPSGKKDNWSRHRFGWWDVSFFCKDIDEARRVWTDEYHESPDYLFDLRDRFASDVFLETTADSTSEEYLQEYCGIFVDEATAYFTYGLIDSCMTYVEKEADNHKPDIDYVEQWETRPVGNEQIVHLGIDFAAGKRGGDATSLQLFEMGNDKKWRGRFHADLTHNDGYDNIDKQLARMVEVIAAFKPQVTRVDATGYGSRIAQELEAKVGHMTDLQPVVFTNELKHDMVTNMKALMERDRISFPITYKELRSQFHNIERTVSPTGKMLYRAKGKGHDDIFFAACLAVKDSARGGFRIITLFDD